MKRRLLLILALVVFLVPMSVIYADTGLDDKGNPNDPATNARANACFGGGSMEGKCKTEWEWTCGWYLIRYDAGMYSRKQVPATCASLLPPALLASTPGPSYPTAGCVLINNFPSYVNFNGGNFLAGGAPQYSASNCTGQLGTFGNALVYAPNGFTDAQAICVANLYTQAHVSPPAYASYMFYCT